MNQTEFGDHMSSARERHWIAAIKSQITGDLGPDAPAIYIYTVRSRASGLTRFSSLQQDHRWEGTPAMSFLALW